jgi:hypothetical protein
MHLVDINQSQAAAAVRVSITSVNADVVELRNQPGKALA